MTRFVVDVGLKRAGSLSAERIGERGKYAEAGEIGVNNDIGLLGEQADSSVEKDRTDRISKVGVYCEVLDEDWLSLMETECL